MKVYELGPEKAWEYVEPEVRDLILERYRPEWVVIDYLYEPGTYEGMGMAIVKPAEDDKLLYFNLAHCSCFGPFGTWWSHGPYRKPLEVTVDEILNPTSVFDVEVTPRVRELVRKLLNGEV
jgi:hypothetical protein